MLIAELWKWVVHFADWVDDLRCFSIKENTTYKNGDKLWVKNYCIAVSVSWSKVESVIKCGQFVIVFSGKLLFTRELQIS